MPASSSSSSEEDLAAFQSVAVSFEEITSKQKEVAEKVCLSQGLEHALRRPSGRARCNALAAPAQAKRRVSGVRSKPKSKKPEGDGEGGPGPSNDSGDEDDGAYDQPLNPVQLKVRRGL